MSQGLSPALLFFLFAAISFIVLRLVVDRLARARKPIFAGPLLAVFGAISGAYFFRLNMHQFFIWHLILFGLVILSWHLKSRVDDKNIAKVTGLPQDKLADGEIVQNYTMTRRLLSFGLVSYLAAFSAAYYYLVTTTKP
ncbi:MAG TPA: hypothetical protein VJL90_11085 [Pseudorhodoplanes sp.]|nr:hypothetical protein [Pseudorhodoplanes sp.]